jgi:glycosyltransferase involved in cell wall biosynthesis
MPQFISIVVPFHNNQDAIQLCCESLLNQTYPANCYEIIFVDNNSTDNSLAIISRYSSIILLQQPVQGSYAARNLGLRTAQGQIIAFTDADCVAAPDWLEQIAAAMESPEIQLILGAYSGIRAKFPASALSAYENAKNRYIFQSEDKSLYYGYTNNMAVRRAVFDQIGLFSEVARGGDVMLVRKFLNLGADYKRSLRYIPNMFVDHLEFNSVLDYFKKVLVHSRSVRGLHGKSLMRPLSNRERHLAFRDMRVSERYSSIQTTLVYLVISFGLLFWIAGWSFPLPQTSGPPNRSE